MRKMKLIVVIGLLLTAGGSMAGPGLIGFKPVTHGTNETHTNMVGTNVFLGHLSSTIRTVIGRLVPMNSTPGVRDWGINI